MKTIREQIIEYKVLNPTAGYRTIGKVFGLSHNTVKYHLSGEEQIKTACRRHKSRVGLWEKLKSEHGGSCKACGYHRCVQVLHFHRLDPLIKTEGVTEIFRLNGYKAASEEAAKCILLCANCHGEVHAGVRTL